MGRKHGDGPGAVRRKPKGYKAPQALAREQAREVARQIITRELEPLLMAHLANALGSSFLVTRHKKTGKFIRVGPAMASRKNEKTIEVWEKRPERVGHHRSFEPSDRQADGARRSLWA